MKKDYQRLWGDVTNAVGEAKAVRALAKIVVNKDGRAFISGLGREEAELCIEVLDYVSCDLRLCPSNVLDRLVRASQSTSSKPTREVLSSSY